MEQFPKIAKARLAAARPGPHPEAEQLGAFSEDALGASERETVLAHLATCVDCRDIVGLAAAARPADTSLAKPVRGGFRWATFQWAAVAASLAIVTVAVLVVGPKETTRQTESAPAVLQPQPLPMPAQAPAAPVSATQSVSVGALKAKTLARREAD